MRAADRQEPWRALLLTHSGMCLVIGVAVGIFTPPWFAFMFGAGAAFVAAWYLWRFIKD